MSEITRDQAIQIVEDIRTAISAGSVTNTMEAQVLEYCVSVLGRRIVEASLSGHIENLPDVAAFLAGISPSATLKALLEGITDAVEVINANIGNGYVYAGIATPSGTPVSGKVFYLAKQAGQYANYGGLTVTEGVNILKHNGSTWTQEQLLSMADIRKNPLIGYYECDTAGDTSAKTVTAAGYVLPATGGSVKIKMANRNTVANATLNINSTGAKPLYYNGQRAGVGNTWDTNEIIEVFYDGAKYQAYNVAGSNGDGVFDISAYNLTDGQPTPYEDLEAALGPDGNHVPLSLRKGGMSIKFVRNDNKYVQYRLMSDTFNTTVANWQGVDDRLIAGSKNLVENGGVAEAINDVRIDGKLVQKGTYYIDYPGPSHAIQTYLGAKNGDKIIVTLMDNNNVIKPGSTLPLYHGDKTSAYTNLSPNTPTSITLNKDVDSFTLYYLKGDCQNAGYIDLVINFEHESYAKQTDFSALKGKVDAIDVPYDDDFSVQVEPNMTGINKRYDIDGKYRRIVISVSDGQYLASDGLIIYGNNVGAAYIIGKCKHGETREFIIPENVNTIIVYANKVFIRATGTVNVNIELYSELLYDVTILGKELKETRIETELSYDNVLSIDSTQSKSYDTGISLNMGQEMLLTLVDNDNIIIAETVPLYFNSTSGSYVNISPNVPKLIAVSELTNLILYVSSSWVSGSGNITLHVDYAKTSNIIDVVLPSKVYGYVGGEFNIYNENVVFITQKDRYYVFWGINDISDYKVYSDRLELIPTVQMIGTHTITCFVKDKYNGIIVYKKQITFEIIANQSVSNKKVLFIGDSLTNAGYYPHFIEYLSNNGIQSIGTRETEVWSSFVEGRKDIVHHEGRGGWSAQDYTRTYPNYRTNYDNPFWDGSKFDFGYYMSEQGYSRPDAVFLNLGTNEIEALDKQVEAIKIMINSIHDYDSTIPVFVHLITPPATQDGWAYGNAGHGDSNTFAVNARNERKRYIEEFDNQITNVFVSPAYFNLDRYHDFATVEEQLSQRNPGIVIRQANNVHPSRYGYYKLADVYYADLMNILS